MDENKRLNVLVLGASGSGKSTLINAISGVETSMGVGEGVTQKIELYQSKDWSLNFIDTKGFEYDRIAQRITIHQVKNSQKIKLKKNRKMKAE